MGSGFDNDVMYAENVDFTGGSPVTGKVTTDGELLIGSTATPNIRVGTLTSPASTIDIGYSSPDITLEAGDSVATDYQTDSGIATPSGNILNVLGQPSGTVPVMFTLGSGSTINIEDRTWTTPLVVDSSATIGLRGTYQTITAALAAASSGQTIFIRAGTYTENLTLKDGVNLCSYDANALSPSVTISGKCSASFSGTAAYSGIRFQTNADYAIEITGAVSTNLYFNNCYFRVLTNSAINNTSSGSGDVFLLYCSGNLAAANTSYFNWGTGTLHIRNCNMDNGSLSTTASVLSVNGSSLQINNSLFRNIINSQDSTNFSATNTNFYGSSNTTFTIAGTGTNLINGCRFQMTTSSCLSISVGASVVVLNSTFSSSNTNAITGAGTISYGQLLFNGTSSTINTTTQTPNVSSNDALKIVTPGAYPYTTVPQDGVILVDSSSARTITPLASPTTGQKHIIKDSVGSAAANNITITPSGKNIDGVASYVIAANYGSATIVYNGSEWNVI